MGQPPAQKAAKAARGQQPKKRPGKALREATKRAQTVKKKGGGKAAAKKAAALPRGSVRAAYPGTCPACFKDYAKGEAITKVTDGWGHPGCAPRRMSAAEREFARNKGPDRERRDVPRPEALGLAARSFAVQHPARPLKSSREMWRRPRTNPHDMGVVKEESDTCCR